LRLSAATAALLIAGTAATAQISDPRVPVNPNEPPWNAVAKVQTNIGTKCTGVLIASTVVLTAAHCLYNPRTRAMLQPVSLHVLFGFERDAYRWHRLVYAAATGGFDASSQRPQSSDWAQLVLAEPVPLPPLPVAGKPPLIGTAVALAGYNQDRAQLLMAGLNCHLRGTDLQPDGAAFLIHDCAGTRGTSGGPLLARQQGGGWTVVGINIAAGRNDNIALLPPFRGLPN
jgi:protease YdgD